jgi:hypothetical protein
MRRSGLGLLDCEGAAAHGQPLSGRIAAFWVIPGKAKFRTSTATQQIARLFDSPITHRGWTVVLARNLSRGPTPSGCFRPLYKCRPCSLEQLKVVSVSQEV